MEAKYKSKHDSSEWHWWLMVATIAVLVVIAASITIWRDLHELQNKVSGVRMPPNGVAQNYSDALHIAMQFFDVQRCNLKSFSPN